MQGSGAHSSVLWWAWRRRSRSAEGDAAAAWPPAKAGYERAKRALDVTVALLVLALGSPLWLAIAITIKLTSPGPAIHRATVIGRQGRPFTWFKFRSMIAADDSQHRAWLREFVLQDAPYQGRTFKLTPDPRVTRLGRILRHFSLDEIPQFINVLRGEMSVVGPRPPLVTEFEHYSPAQARRLAIRPGITGLHQVTQRSRACFSQMLAVDLDYIERRSIALDLSVMARTVLVMATGRGAA